MKKTCLPEEGKGRKKGPWGGRGKQTRSLNTNNEVGLIAAKLKLMEIQKRLTSYLESSTVIV